MVRMVLHADIDYYRLRYVSGWNVVGVCGDTCKSGFSIRCQVCIAPRVLWGQTQWHQHGRRDLGEGIGNTCRKRTQKGWASKGKSRVGGGLSMGREKETNGRWWGECPKVCGGGLRSEPQKIYSRPSEEAPGVGKGRSISLGGKTLTAAQNYKHKSNTEDIFFSPLIISFIITLYSIIICILLLER